jgi:hypothetical protein
MYGASKMARVVVQDWAEELAERFGVAVDLVRSNAEGILDYPSESSSSSWMDLGLTSLMLSSSGASASALWRCSLSTVGTTSFRTTRLSSSWKANAWRQDVTGSNRGGFCFGFHGALRMRMPNQLLHRTLDPVVCPLPRSVAGIKRR